MNSSRKTIEKANFFEKNKYGGLISPFQKNASNIQARKIQEAFQSMEENSCSPFGQTIKMGQILFNSIGYENMKIAISLLAELINGRPYFVDTHKMFEETDRKFKTQQGFSSMTPDTPSMASSTLGSRTRNVVFESLDNIEIEVFKLTTFLPRLITTPSLEAFQDFVFNLDRLVKKRKIRKGLLKKAYEKILTEKGELEGKGEEEKQAWASLIGWLNPLVELVDPLELQEPTYHKSSKTGDDLGSFKKFEKRRRSRESRVSKGSHKNKKTFEGLVNTIGKKKEEDKGLQEDDLDLEPKIKKMSFNLNQLEQPVTFDDIHGDPKTTLEDLSLINQIEGSAPQKAPQVVKYVQSEVINDIKNTSIEDNPSIIDCKTHEAGEASSMNTRSKGAPNKTSRQGIHIPSRSPKASPTSRTSKTSELSLRRPKLDFKLFSTKRPSVQVKVDIGNIYINSHKDGHFVKTEEGDFRPEVRVLKLKPRFESFDDQEHECFYQDTSFGRKASGYSGKRFSRRMSQNSDQAIKTEKKENNQQRERSERPFRSLREEDAIRNRLFPNRGSIENVQSKPIYYPEEKKLITPSSNFNKDGLSQMHQSPKTACKSNRSKKFGSLSKSNKFPITPPAKVNSKKTMPSNSRFSTRKRHTSYSKASVSSVWDLTSPQQDGSKTERKAKDRPSPKLSEISAFRRNNKLSTRVDKVHKLNKPYASLFKSQRDSGTGERLGTFTTLRTFHQSKEPSVSSLFKDSDQVNITDFTLGKLQKPDPRNLAPVSSSTQQQPQQHAKKSVRIPKLDKLDKKEKTTPKESRPLTDRAKKPFNSSKGLKSFIQNIAKLKEKQTTLKSKLGK